VFTSSLDCELPNLSFCRLYFHINFVERAVSCSEGKYWYIFQILIRTLSKYLSSEVFNCRRRPSSSVRGRGGLQKTILPPRKSEKSENDPRKNHYLSDDPIKNTG